MLTRTWMGTRQPLLSYLKGLRDAGYDGVVSIELEYSPQPDRILEWVTEAYQKTAELMSEAGVWP